MLRIILAAVAACLLLAVPASAAQCATRSLSVFVCRIKATDLDKSKSAHSNVQASLMRAPATPAA